MIARRTLVAGLAAMALLGPADAQSYPSRVIKLVVPFTPGSPNDVMARLLTEHLSPRLGQPIVIDNKPGGGTSIGTKTAAAADPDGYTLLFISSAIIIDPAMKHVAYDPLKDFAPVATVNTTAWLITVSPSLPVKTLAEFVAYTKAHPGTVNFAATQGTAAILVAEKFKQLSGADLFIIPYKGGAAALPDFLGGRIQVLNPTPSTSIPLIRDGKMRALLITSPERSAELPDVPTAREVGLPDLTLEFWAGVLAPAGTPPGVIGKINTAINDTLRSPETKAAMSKLGMSAKIGSPQDYAKFIAEETPRWTEIVKSTGVKLE
jgi:tripartite-type tricarboxylate transporter receptor subunit TctC